MSDSTTAKEGNTPNGQASQEVVVTHQWNTMQLQGNKIMPSAATWTKLEDMLYEVSPLEIQNDPHNWVGGLLRGKDVEVQGWGRWVHWWYVMYLSYVHEEPLVTVSHRISINNKNKTKQIISFHSLQSHKALQKLLRKSQCLAVYLQSSRKITIWPGL